MDFYAIENNDAIRLSWNNLPCSKMSVMKLVVPPCVLYSPNKDLENLALLEYDPLICKCHAIVNPSCIIDFRSKTWNCIFCGARNNFPNHYASHISEENLPAELID
jgi:protein transport protein SEC23